MEPKKIFFGLAVFWTIGLTILSLISLNDVKTFDAIVNKDKYVHFLFYFLFSILWGVVFNCKKVKHVVLIFFVALLYGIMMELAQGLFTTSRQPDVLDVLANSIGAFAGCLMLNCYLKKTV